MIQSLGKKFLAFPLLAGLSLLVACAASQTEKLASKQQFSGYLSNYSDLKEVQGEQKGVEYLRWMSPEVKSGKYTKILPRGASFYPQLTPEQQASRQTLIEIRDYYDEAVKREYAAMGILATEPGPGVATAEFAITGVYIQAEGMKAYDVVPIAAVISLTEAATGTRDRVVQLVMEGKLVDSESGKLLATAVYKGLGKDLPNDKTQLTLADLKPLLDEWARNLASTAAAVINAGK